MLDAPDKRVARHGGRPAAVRMALKLLAGVLKAGAIAAATTLAVGFLYQFAATAIEARTLHLPGALVDIGGRRLRVHCVGEGSPAVILEAGLGATAESWDWVQQQLGGFTRTCAYDRAGIGDSDPAPGPRDAEAASADLDRLLDALRVPGPAVVAGHSYGGLVARVYAWRHPDRVAGLVLVDSAHEDMGERFPPPVRKAFRELLGSFGVLKALAPFAIPRWLGVPQSMAAGLSPTPARLVTASFASYRQLEGASREADAWDRSASEARQARAFGGLPLVVLVAGGWPPIVRPSWFAMQQDLASRSTRSRLLVLEGADHPGMIQDRRYAAVVAQQIRAVVMTVRWNAAHRAP